MTDRSVENVSRSQLVLTTEPENEKKLRKILQPAMWSANKANKDIKMKAIVTGSEWDDKEQYHEDATNQKKQTEQDVAATEVDKLFSRPVSRQTNE